MKKILGDDQELARKIPRPLAEALEGVAGGGDSRVDAVTLAAVKEFAVDSVVFLERTDDGFDRRAPFKVAFDLSVDAALLA